MDELQMFKEKQINEYISSIDMENIDPTQIKTELKNKLGEEPAVKLNYVTETILNESNEEPKKVETLESLTIVFTVDREVMPGLTVPFPITKTFLIG